MKASHSFVKTLRDAPKDETAKSAGYLLRAGYIHKELAGVYTYLPMGLKVLNHIEQIIREELNSIGCQEIQMTALQNPDLWQKTDRWSDDAMDVWFKTRLHAGDQELGLAPTHEEPVTNLLRNYVNSYKDLPIYIYQFQTKFRNELRAKSGILRTREFLMKDLYSFTTDLESHEEFYHIAEQAYTEIYARLGIGEDTYQTFASGGAFSKFSHEYQTITLVGEDTIYFNEDKSIVLNEEVVIPEVLEDLHISRSELQTARACEVGNIFSLGTKYSSALGLKYTDTAGCQHPVYMGCYGIGLSRVMGVIAEKFADDRGLYWPENIAPYRYYLIAIGAEATKHASKLHDRHPDLFYYDDRDARPGVKFTDADLIGLPYRLVISDKTLESASVELLDRRTGKAKHIPLDSLTKNPAIKTLDT